MKRVVAWPALLLAMALVAPAIRADVKTREKTSAKLEGLLGSFAGMMGGSGGASTVAVKGDRMARMGDASGEIVDLAEQKVYHLDVKKKAYTVVTFAEMRRQLEDARQDLQQQQQQMSQTDKDQFQAAGKPLEFDVDMKDTGNRKTIAGQDTHEVILTLAMREKGRKIEESGGMVMTSDMWLAAHVPALDELQQFQKKMFKMMYDGVFTGMDAQQASAMSAMIPGFGTLQARMAEERGRLQGTALVTVTTMESVKSADAMKAAANQPPPRSGGGLGGLIAGGMMRGRGQVQQRTKTLTTTHEYVSIETSVSDPDVGIPAGYKEKK
jgi:hypothetical protein